MTRPRADGGAARPLHPALYVAVVLVVALALGLLALAPPESFDLALVYGGF
jgi:hypothetical protein